MKTGAESSGLADKGHASALKFKTLEVNDYAQMDYVEADGRLLGAAYKFEGANEDLAEDHDSITKDNRISVSISAHRSRSASQNRSSQPRSSQPRSSQHRDSIS